MAVLQNRDRSLVLAVKTPIYVPVDALLAQMPTDLLYDLKAKVETVLGGREDARR